MKKREITDIYDWIRPPEIREYLRKNHTFSMKEKLRMIESGVCSVERKYEAIKRLYDMEVAPAERQLASRMLVLYDWMFEKLSTDRPGQVFAYYDIGYCGAGDVRANRTGGVLGMFRTYGEVMEHLRENWDFAPEKCIGDAEQISHQGMLEKWCVIDGRMQEVLGIEIFEMDGKVCFQRMEPLIIKLGSDTGQGLRGAKIEVLDGKGRKVLGFSTMEDGVDITGKLAVGKTYTFKEVEAPKGYKLAKPVKYTIRDTGKLQKVSMTDEKTHKPHVPQNPDWIGWLKIRGTTISYPVMQRKGDSEYYLHRDFDGNYSFRGTPFLDIRCTPDSDNCFIYGHNINGGRMFGVLHKYAGREYYLEHPEMEVRFGEKKRSYGIAAVIRTTTASGIYSFTDTGNWEEYRNYVKQILSGSLYPTKAGEEIKRAMGKDSLEEFFRKYQFVSLSTCRTWAGKDARFLVIGAVERKKMRGGR